MEKIFSLVCDQDPSHTWAPGGVPLPFCQRCTGLYVGAAIALTLLLLFRPVPNGRYRWFHAMLLLLMAPFGFHLVPQGPVLRTMSGQWFAFGIMGLLWLQPAARLFKAPNRLYAGGKTELHLLMGAASLILLPVLAHWGGGAAALALPWIAMAGLLILASFSVANIVLLLSDVLTWFQPRAGRATR